MKRRLNKRIKKNDFLIKICELFSAFIFSLNTEFVYRTIDTVFLSIYGLVYENQTNN